MKNNFLWGAASAAYQVEGAYQNDGKGISIWDEFANFPGNTYKNTNGNIACDHYHRFREDIALMKELGLKTYRFSISWSRILPLGKGKVNEKGIQFYQQLCKELIENGIEPMVTLYHWDLPLALQEEYGGWEDKKIIDDFVDYAQICFQSLHTYVNHWIVMNEPNIFTSMGYLTAQHPPKKTSLELYLKTFHHSVLAHAKTILKYKELGLKGKIGSSIAYMPSYAFSSDPLDIKALEYYQSLTSEWFFQSYYNGNYPKIALDLYQSIGINFIIDENDLKIMEKGAQYSDFIGINYYQSICIAHSSDEFKLDQKELQKDISGLYKQIKDPLLEYTDWSWAIDPKGLTKGIVKLHEDYHKPILISENGLGAYDQLENQSIHDSYRIDYLRKHICALKDAINQGVDIIGYCVWSFTDLLSWLNGYEKRYGLVYIDFEHDLKRIKKNSFTWYQKVIQTNGERL